MVKKFDIIIEKSSLKLILINNSFIFALNVPKGGARQDT